MTLSRDAGGPGRPPGCWRRSHRDAGQQVLEPAIPGHSGARAVEWSKMEMGFAIGIPELLPIEADVSRLQAEP